MAALFCAARIGKKQAAVVEEFTAAERLDAVQALEALSSIVLGDQSFTAIVERVIDVAQRTIPGADQVSVTRQNGRPVTLASSGPIALRADEAQYAAESGPCLDAIRLGEVVIVADQASESRWPGYTRAAFAAGVRSSLSVPLCVDGDCVGAFNSYALVSHAFGDDAVTTGLDLAAYAAILLNNVTMYFTMASRAEQLEQALSSRAEIEQAKGILMGVRKCSADEAFDILVRLSQRSGRKLREVAASLVETTVRGE